MINNNLTREAYSHMGNNKMEPKLDLEFDGEIHDYEAYVDGECLPAQYQFFWQPDEKLIPRLFGEYWLKDKSKIFSYSSYEKNIKQY